MKLERRIGSTVEFPAYGMTQVWVGPGLRLQIYHTKVDHPVHSHTYNLKSKVLHAPHGFTEFVYDDDGKPDHEVRHYEGEIYDVAQVHQLMLEPLVVTLVIEGDPTGQQGQVYDNPDRG